MTRTGEAAGQGGANGMAGGGTGGGTAIAFPWDPLPPRPARPGRPGGRRGGGGESVAPAIVPLAPARLRGVQATDWLCSHLVVRGPAATLGAFRAAAAGPGVVPWRIDHAAMEEDLFHRLALACAGTGRLSVAGCHAFAAQFRERAEARHVRALELAATGRAACPFDLQALIPVPAPVLALGPDHGQARLWLREHWGTEALRRVETLPPAPGRSTPGPGVPDPDAPDPAVRGSRAEPGPPVGAGADEEWRVRFFSADWSPWQALLRLRQDWPGLSLALQPVYDAS